MDLLIVDGQATDAARGRQLAFVLMVLGGIPSSLTAMALAAYTRRRARAWSSGWSLLFGTGFVFQLCCLALSGLLLVVLLMSTPILLRDAGEIGPLVGAAAAALMFAGLNALGAKSWRALQLAADGPPPRLVS